MELDTIVCSDCLDVMADMPDGCVDLVITDPPFNKGKDFANDDLSWPTFLEWYEQVFVLIYQKLKNNHPLLVEMPKIESCQLKKIIELVGFVFEYPLVLYTTNNMLRGKVGYNHYGLCMWFSKGKSRPRYCYPDVIKAALKSTKKEFRHPAPKNERHYTKLIDLFTDIGDLVFDPFIGSGTTAVAALKLNRHFYGCDINSDYVEMAKSKR